MDITESFFITLPSNVKPPGEYFNSVANYTTKLPRRLRLKGKWEVGLAEISYSYSWYNIKRKCSVNLCMYDSTTKRKKKLIIYDGEYIEPGRYENLSVLVEQIKLVCSKYLKLTSGEHAVNYIPPSIVFDEKSRKVKIIHGKMISNVVYLCLDNYLCEKLGINYMKLKANMDVNMANYDRLMRLKMPVPNQTEEDRTLIAERPVELDAGCKSLFVYSNIVQNSFVGDTTAPILRLVEVPNDCKFGDQVVMHYASPHYIPLITNEFDIIEIHLKDDVDESIPFEFGRTLVKLHFRKVY